MKILGEESFHGVLPGLKIPLSRRFFDLEVLGNDSFCYHRFSPSIEGFWCSIVFP